MRHLGSIVLTLLLAPVTWVLTGMAISKFAEARADSAGFGVDLAVALAAILGAGLCYALLVLPRLSPLGPVLAGLGFLGLVVWRVADLDGFNRAVPADLLDVTLALRNPADGYAALLAVPLLGTMFSLRRWRRYDQPPAEYAEYAAPMAPAYPASPYPDSPDQGYPLIPGMPNVAYPPQQYLQPQQYQQPSQPAGPVNPTVGADDPTWPLPTDTGSTSHL